MFEGKHIHFSPTDNKPLCSYSGKLCRQRRLNGYAFCIRHILEDKSAPFKQCSYVTRNNSQKCLNAIPSSQDRGYCHSHMQVVGIIPKTERKSKALTVSKSDSNSISTISSNSSDKSSSSPVSKQDPGAVFRFEEDSSDISDVFSYKNGLGNSIHNGKCKGSSNSKDKEDNSAANSSKNGKTSKTQIGLTARFTTKKITDKNRNVYTAIIPNNTDNSNGNKKTVSQKQKTASWCNSSDDSLTVQHHRFSAASDYSGKKTGVRKADKNELKNVHNAEEIRQFEHLETLNKLNRSIVDKTSISSDDENSCDAKFKIFPRLASTQLKELVSDPTLSTRKKRTLHPDSDESSVDDKSSVKTSDFEHQFKCETTTSNPPLITRTNKCIIIKTESQPRGVKSATTKLQKNLYESTTSNTKETFAWKEDSNRGGPDNTSEITDEDHCNSNESTDLNHRREFLAHVRNTFKSHYSSIKKASQVHERYDEDRKQKFRKSLVRCVQINSGICAQVLVGNGKKVSALVKKENLLGTSSRNLNKNLNDDSDDKYDDYEFFDNDVLSSSTATKACTAIVDHIITTKSRKKLNGEGGVKKERSSKSIAKGLQETGKKEKGPISLNLVTEALEKGANNVRIGSSISTSKNAKRVVEGECINESSSGMSLTSPFKRRLKRADAIVETGSGDSLHNSINSMNIHSELVNCNSLSSVSDKIKIRKRRRFGSNDINGGASTEINNVTRQQSPILTSSAFEIGEHANSNSSTDGNSIVKCEKRDERRYGFTFRNDLSHGNDGHHHHDILRHSTSLSTHHRNQGLETVLNSVGSSENAGTPDGVITDASFDSTFEHSTSSQPGNCEYSEDDLENSFELQIDPEIENQASRLLEDNVLTEADFTELFPDNRMSDHKFGRNDMQELGMAALDFDVNDIDYSLFANIFPNFPRNNQPESISISNPF